MRFERVSHSAEVVSCLHHRLRRFESLGPERIEFIPFSITFTEGPVTINVHANDEDGIVRTKPKENATIHNGLCEAQTKEKVVINTLPFETSIAQAC